MRKRISKYKHLHSNRFRYLSSSIPLICASGLLVTLGFMLCPIQNRNASAEGEVSSEEAPGTSETVVSEEPASDSTGPMKQTRGASTVSIALDDPEVINLKADAVTNEVAYISKGFKVTASNNYNIYVQTSNSSSDLTNGTSIIRSITGTNVTPTNFSDNTWGYTVADNTPTVSTLTYNAIPTNTTNAIKSGTGAVTNKQFTLAFAAKFGSSATAGHYKTGIVLSVAANPGEVTGTLNDITYMQEMTKSICTETLKSDTKQLIDQRDSKMYWVTKLADGNCWMTQNLDYDDPNSIRVDAPSSWTNTTASYRAYYDPKDSRIGNYYSWQSATNGTGSSVSSDGANASDSICPTNWKLPTSKVSTSGSFAALTAAYNIGSDATGSTKLQSSPLNFVPGGYVYSGNLSHAGYGGYYWSSTADGSTQAYFLYFDSSTVNPSGYNFRYFGVSVRCLVQGS